MSGIDTAGGDGSDNDLQEIADEAGAEALAALYDFCTNPGMEALADLIADEVQSQADDMPSGVAPDMDSMFGAISGVHSPDTAASCMTEAIGEAYARLDDGYSQIVDHELSEGVSFL